MVPADRLETTEAVGHGTEHDGRVLTEASRHGCEPWRALLAADDGVVGVDVGRASVSQGGLSRPMPRRVSIDKVHAAEGADAAHADTGAVLTDLVLNDVSHSGVFTKVKRHVGVDEADVHAAVQGRNASRHAARNGLADHRQRQWCRQQQAARGSGGVAAVQDVGAANKEVLNDLVDRVAHVVTDDVRSVSIHVEERGATQLRRGGDSVAVLGKGHGNGRVAQGNSGHISSPSVSGEVACERSL